MKKCPVCNKKFKDKEAIYPHIEKVHSDMIPKNMSASQFYYMMVTGKDHGRCIVCGSDTKWNEKTNKYHRFCGNPKCKEKYRDMFKKRMISKYGKVSLLDDPKHQVKMLQNRKISGRYKWGDGKEVPYTGSYELDFLKFLDVFLEYSSEDIMAPSPHTYYYEYEGERKFYIPDFFIPSLNLEIEIKEGGDNPNMHEKIVAVDKVKEKLKDEVLTSQKTFNYIKITDKNYKPFFEFLAKAKDQYIELQKNAHRARPIFILGEAFMSNVAIDIENFDISNGAHLQKYIQAEYIDESLNQDKIPDTLYFGSPNKIDKLHSRVFLTPHIGIASLFIVDNKDIKSIRGYNCNLSYDAWLYNNNLLQEPLDHVSITHNIPEVKGIEKGNSKGYIYAIDVSDVKYELKLAITKDPNREFIYEGRKPLKILNVTPHAVTWSCTFNKDSHKNAPMPYRINKKGDPI